MAKAKAKLALAGFLFALIGMPACALQPAAPALPPLVSEDTTPHALPFKGRLASGDPRELPPAVAMSLSSASPITFQYREELSHDEYHIPLYVSAFDPVTYFGSPLGDFGVTAFASLTITDADGKVVADYTRRAYVSKSYSLYAEPTHRELEEAARSAVRAKIDQSLYGDSNRLAHALSVGNPRKDSSE
ncbi:MAG TPA: hypothetical protein VHY56_07725 [Candidatus Binataceae bacterium]|jgi:hypothetical protein|nr:hypothetical protein [Candidatus Binataceae bacterium]